MSIFSQAWKRIGGAVQAVAKPFVSAIPVVGTFAASRILMSPTPLQGQLEASTSPQVAQFANVVRQDATAAAALPTGGGSTPMLPAPAATPSTVSAQQTAGMMFGMPRQTFFMVIGLVVFVALLLVVTRRK